MRVLVGFCPFERLGGRLQPRLVILLIAEQRRVELLEKVWDYHFDPQTNIIDQHVSRLRQKIDKDFSPPLLQTVRGVGYTLRLPDRTA